MFRNTLLSIASLLLCFQTTLGQTNKHCATDDEFNRLKSLYPNIVSNDRDLEDYIQQALSRMDLSRFAQKGTGVFDEVVYDIPVVVHIIHNYNYLSPSANANEYISDTSVYNAIQYWNMIYARGNSDTVDLIPSYKGNIKTTYNADTLGNLLPVTGVRYVGKADIRFHLATKDPEGQPTHGITRTQHNLYNTGSNQAKLDQWSPTSYLNVWVVQAFDENYSVVAAYALYPSSAAETPYSDGVIVLAEYFGFQHPKTVPHEIGHYLNLFHPWGNTNDPELECGDDNVDDTPPTYGHYGSGCSSPVFNKPGLLQINDTTCAAGFRYTFGPPPVPSELVPVADNYNYLGIDFVAKSAISLNAVNIYPTAAIGTPFQITLRHYGFVIATYDTVSTTSNGAQTCHLNFSVPADSGYSLVLTINPNALRDSNVTSYLKDTTGIRLKNDIYGGFYNYFYKWQVGVGSSTVTLGKPGLSVTVGNTIHEGLALSTFSRLTMKAVTIYPAAEAGSLFTIALNKGSVSGPLVASYTDTVLTPFMAQVVPVNFAVPDAGKYFMTFSLNPGAIRDSVYLSSSWLINAVMRIDNGFPSAGPSSFYNYFHDLDILYGYAKTYANSVGGDSVVDYPDTTNAQNIMDYTNCDRMFTYGQTRRMRAALESPTAGRNNLWTADNLEGTGVWADVTGTPAPFPDLRPIPDFSLKNNKVFTCADGVHTLSFADRSWNDTIETRTWTFSNDASSPTSTSSTVNNNKFSVPGWITVSLTAGSNTGDSTITRTHAAYAADPLAMSPLGYFQEFTDLEKWPVFNYFQNNNHRWKPADVGYYDAHAIVFENNDFRSYPASNLGSPRGIVSDFFSPAFDLSDGSFSTNCNINFMSAGASRTADPSQQNDILELAYSINCGDSWITFDSLKQGDLANAGVIADPFVPAWMGAWKAQYFNLPTAVRGKPQVFFRFRYKVGVSEKMSLDAGGNPYAGPQYYHGTGNNFYMDRVYISNYPLGIFEDLAKKQGLIIAPNPTSGSATLTIPGENGQAEITVTDIAGKIIYRNSCALNGRSMQVEIPGNSLPAKGMYMVQVQTQRNAYSVKLVVN